MKRVMCVWLPEWPLQRLQSVHREDEPEPVPRVLYAESARRGLRVVICCRNTARQGVRPGMPLAEARGLLKTTSGPQPQLLEHDPQADRTALEGLAGWCQRFSPVVGIEGTDSLLLDISSCAELFGGERRLAGQLSRAVGRWGLCVRTAIADTPGAAWALARFGNETPEIVPPGQQAAAMDPLPVAALRIPENVLSTLADLGLRRIGQVRGLPRSSLPSRFGPELIRRLDQALGELAEPIEPIRAPEPIEVRREFEYSTGDRRALEAVLDGLIEQLAGKLSAAGLGVRELEIGLLETTKEETCFTVGCLRPSQAVSHLRGLTFTRLEQVIPQAEIIGVRVKAVTTARLESQQTRLFETGENSQAGRLFAELVDRMSNRLGKDRVLRPLLQPDAQPEFAVLWEPATAAQATPPAAQFPWLDGCPALARPLHLHPEPLPIQVTSVVPDGPPIRFFGKTGMETVAHWWGPERIETGWWRDRHIRRDYFHVETESGNRLWLFRRVDRGDWFLHGEFE